MSCRRHAASEPNLAELVSFDSLFASTRQQVFGLCYRVLGNHAEAEEATQETFLEVYRSLRSFRGDASPTTWVYRIALRVSVKVRTRRNRLRSSEALVTERVDTSEQHQTSHLDLPRVVSAMEQLSFEHRAVLSLFAVEGLGHKQIAEVLGIPEGTVWSRLHVARKKLKKALK